MNRRIFTVFVLAVAVLALTAAGEEDPSSLLGTKWKLVGYVDTAAKELKEADRSTYWHCVVCPIPVEEATGISTEKWYTLEFDPIRFFYSGYLSSTEFYGVIQSYRDPYVEYTSYFTSIFGKPENPFEGGPGPVPEDRKYFYALADAQTFEQTDTSLKIYYLSQDNEKMEYLLFKPQEKVDDGSVTNPNKIHEADRIVSQSKSGKEENAVIATPEILLSAGDFAEGPNPVAKSVGLANFYRVGKQVKSASLKIYDASGKAVGKITIADRGQAGNSQSRSKRQVGSWDLKDAKGRPVSEGTYLVKGTIKTVDGKSEKVALLISVR